MTTVSSVPEQGFFIVPNLEERAKVLYKNYEGKIFVSRGPDHHGRIIYGEEVKNLNPNTVVQLIHRTVYDYMMD